MISERVSSETLAVDENARETVDWETPNDRATSYVVGARLSSRFRPLSFGIVVSEGTSLPRLADARERVRRSCEAVREQMAFGEPDYARPPLAPIIWPLIHRASSV